MGHPAGGGLLEPSRPQGDYIARLHEAMKPKRQSNDVGEYLGCVPSFLDYLFGFLDSKRTESEVPVVVVDNTLNAVDRL